MKNKFVASLAGFFLAVLYTTANGQASVASVSDEINARTEYVTKKDLDSIKHDQSCQDVLRNFKGKITDARWYESSFGFVIKFNVTGVDHRVDLDKNGNWLRTIRSYEEMKLPMNVKRVINNLYNGYSISFVQEIEVPFQSLTFVVNLEGKKDIVQVRVSGDETEECQRFNKPHSEGFTSNNRN